MEAAAGRVGFLTLSRLFFSFVLTSAACATLGAGQKVSTSDKVAWLASHASGLHSFDPRDSDFSDLEPLQQAIGKSRVVLLTGAREAPVVAARSRLVRFLHEQMGFDILASMMPFFDAEEFDGSLDHGKSPAADIEFLNRSVFAAGEQAPSHFNIWSYVRSTHKSDRPLHLAGFAPFISPFMVDAYSHQLSQFLNRVAPNLASRAELHAIQKFVLQCCLPVNEPIHTAGNGLQLLSTRPPQMAVSGPGLAAIGKLYDGLGRLTAVGYEAQEIAFYRETLRSLATYPGGHSYVHLPDQLDREEHLVHMMHPDGKIIVWSPVGLVGQSMFGRDIYSIGLSLIKSDNGVLEVIQAGSPPRFAPVDGDLESLIHAARKPISFIDFRGVPEGHWLRGPLTARPFGVPDTSVWPRRFDGLMTIDFPTSKEHKQ